MKLLEKLYHRLGLVTEKDLQLCLQRQQEEMRLLWKRQALLRRAVIEAVQPAPDNKTEIHRREKVDELLNAMAFLEEISKTPFFPYGNDATNPLPLP